jgi:hypothetical protein
VRTLVILDAVAVKRELLYGLIEPRGGEERHARSNGHRTVDR